MPGPKFVYVIPFGTIACNKARTIESLPGSVTVLFQMGRKDIVDVAGNADSRCYHGKQGAHPFIILAADIGLPALFHDVVAEQMFGILLKTVLFPVCFPSKNRRRCFFLTAGHTGIGNFHLVGLGRNPRPVFRSRFLVIFFLGVSSVAPITIFQDRGGNIPGHYAAYLLLVDFNFLSLYHEFHIFDS